MLPAVIDQSTALEAAWLSRPDVRPASPKSFLATTVSNGFELASGTGAEASETSSSVARAKCATDKSYHMRPSIAPWKRPRSA